jgi:hypothetical protein
LKNVEFVRYELDAEGHAYQRLALGEETLELYPILDPISLEHALEVERAILPAIVALYEAEPSRPEFDPFRRFVDLFEAVRSGGGAAAAGLDDIAARVLEAVRAAINDLTPPDEVRRRAFACFYRHATCDNDGYRQKALASLERLVTRVSETYGEEA